MISKCSGRAETFKFVPAHSRMPVMKWSSASGKSVAQAPPQRRP